MLVGLLFACDGAGNPLVYRHSGVYSLYTANAITNLPVWLQRFGGLQLVVAEIASWRSSQVDFGSPKPWHDGE